MKTYTIIAACLVMQSTIGCEAPTTTSSEMSSTHQIAMNPAKSTAILWVKGIGCPGCIPNVEGPLTKLSGVENVLVDLPTGKVTVTLASGRPATRDELKQAIVDSGFTLDSIEMP